MLAFGIGDLHLPVGQGDVPFTALAAACTFPSDAIAVIELYHRYWYDLAPCIAATRDFMAKATRAAA